MSRRRNRPNLPEETLRRARLAAGLEAAPAEKPADEATTPAAATERARETAAPAVDSRAALRAARRRKRLARASEAARQSETMDAEAIAERLRAPTRTVSEGQLREAYAYVLRDLRGMAMLAAVLIGALVVLALALGV